MSPQLLTSLSFLLCFLLTLIAGIWWLVALQKTDTGARITNKTKPLLIIIAIFPFITLLLTITHIIELSDATSRFYLFSFLVMPIAAFIASALLARHYRNSYVILNAVNIVMIPIYLFLALIIYMFTDNNFSF